MTQADRNFIETCKEILELNLDVPYSKFQFVTALTAETNGAYMKYDKKVASLNIVSPPIVRPYITFNPDA